MRTTLIAIALAVSLPAAADQLDGWTHGEAGIYTHTPEGPMQVGQVAADGTLTFEWPSVWSTEQTLARTFPSCRDDGAPIANPGGTEFWPTSLFIAIGEEKELGGLHLVTSPEVAAWRGSFGQDSAAKGAWFQFVHVTQDSTVEADCRMPTYTGEDEDLYEAATVYQVRFKDGWNLMRNDITQLHAAPSGKQHASRLEVSVVEGKPDDAIWYFEAY